MSLIRRELLERDTLEELPPQGGGNGSRLRRARLEQGLTIEQIALRARIPARYLSALEAEDTATLPPGPFLRGYRRQYAAFLGLEVEDTSPPQAELSEAETLDLEGGVTGPAGLSPAAERTEDTTLTIPRHEEAPMLRLVMTGFVVTLLALLALRLGSHAVDGAQGLNGVGLDGTGLDPVSLVTGAAGTPLAVAEEGSKGAAALLGVQRVSVRAVEPVRVVVVADGEPVHSGTLHAGKSIVGVGKRVSVDIGDLTRVVVHANGERVEPLHNLTASRSLVFVQDPG